MALKPFNNTEPADILAALYRGCDPAQVVSIQFRAEVPPARTIDPLDQWRRIKLILGCEEVHNAFGVRSFPIDVPAVFNYATGLETIGTLANLLTRGGVHRRFVEDNDQAFDAAKTYLNRALLGELASTEAYSCRDGWCDWFLSDFVLDETILLGDRGDWWLLAVTGTD